MPSPTCTINTGATAGGVDVLGGATVTVQLVDLAGVRSWALTCIGTDDATSSPTISINSVTKTATFTASANPAAYILRSVINGGVDVNGTAQASYTTTMGVYVLTTDGLRLIAANETTEASVTHGWSSTINAIYRDGIAGGASDDGFTQIALTGAGPTTVTQEQFNTRALEFTGTPTAGHEVILPLGSSGGAIVRNSTTTSSVGIPLRFKGSSGAGTNLGVNQTKPVVSTSAAIIGDNRTEHTSLANLKALTPVAGDVAFARGFTTAGDGGGGDFYWDSASTTTDDGGTVLQLNAGGTGRWKRIYHGALFAKWFGSQLNDATLQLAVNAAQSSASKHLIVEGTWTLTATVTVANTSDLHIQGVGRAVIKMANGGTGNVKPQYIMSITGTSSQRHVVSHIRFERSGRISTPCAVVTDGLHDGMLYTGSASGGNLLVDGCEFFLCNHIGLVVASGDVVIVRDCIMKDNAYAGSQILCQNLQVEGGAAIRNGKYYNLVDGYGYTGAQKQAQYVGVYVDGHYSHALDTHGTTNTGKRIVVTGCQIGVTSYSGGMVPDPLAGQGVAISQSTGDVIITNNVFFGDGTNEVVCAVTVNSSSTIDSDPGMANVIISNNTFSKIKSSSGAIYVRPSDCKNLEINNNCISEGVGEYSILVDPFDGGTAITTKRYIPLNVSVFGNKIYNGGRVNITAFGLLDFDHNTWIETRGTETVTPFTFGTAQRSCGILRFGSNNRAMGPRIISDAGTGQQLFHSPTDLRGNYSHKRGDVVPSISPLPGGIHHWRCTASGTNGTIGSCTATLAATLDAEDSGQREWTVDNVLNLVPGMFITIGSVVFDGEAVTQIVEVTHSGSISGAGTIRVSGKYSSGYTVPAAVAYGVLAWQACAPTELFWGETSRLKVDGTGMGAFGVTPVAQPTMTQTYSTADATIVAVTATTVGSAVPTDAAALTSYGFTEAQANAIVALLNQARVDILALAADLLADKKNLNAVVDKLQSLGWFG